MTTHVSNDSTTDSQPLNIQMLALMLAAAPKPAVSVGFKTVILGAADRRDDDFRHGRGQGSVT